jgi:DNA-binding IclR family transcriptional regulator
LQLGLGFWGSSAIELGLFSLLAAGPLTSEQITHALWLHPRGTRDFLDALVSLGLLDRQDGHYGNTRP